MIMALLYVPAMQFLLHSNALIVSLFMPYGIGSQQNANPVRTGGDHFSTPSPKPQAERVY
jgi:hypothetical protein